ncbi:MAG TPA: flagellar motor protein MotB [Desulfonatronum sp.]|nr:flagellar motor protein MotB [Desulfonatronum sp.]
MNKSVRNVVVSAVSLLILVLFLAGSGLAQTERIVPKAENFLFFMDHSGSMAMSAPSGAEKIAEAKDVLLAVNNDIPVMPFNAGVFTYAPFKEYVPAEAYSKPAVAQAVGGLKESYEIYGRLTPMGFGLQSLDSLVGVLSGRTAVIVVTDGESNLGPKPVSVMQDMYAKYGNNICFHIISFAQSAKEKALVDQMSAINPCTVSAVGADLMDDAKRADFVRKVFYDVEIIPAAPVAEPEPVKPVVEEVIVFRSVHFDFDKSNIKPEFVPVLKEASEMIKARPGKNVVVEGHTCNIGPAVYNQGLSERRAASVRNFLINEGIAAERLKAVGFGLNNPKYDNTTREGRSLNRRVELRFE